MERESGQAGIGTAQPETTREHCTRADLTEIKIAEH